MELSPNERLIRICKSAFERNLTNVSGGNFSLRLQDGTFLATRTHNTKNTLMVLTPEDLLRVDIQGRPVEQEGKVTSSWITHAAIYSSFPGVNAVIHAHPLYTTVFAAAGCSIEPLLDGMRKFGTIPILSGKFKVDSPGFAQEVVELLRVNQSRLEQYGHGVLYPMHGALVAGPSIEDAYDLLDRIESNAVALLFLRFVPKNGN